MPSERATSHYPGRIAGRDPPPVAPAGGHRPAVRGHLWAGVPLAEAEFKARAQRVQLKPEELRRRMKERYSEQLETMRKLREAGTSDAEQATNKADATESNK